MAISECWLAIFLYKGRSLVLYSKSLAADHIHWRNSQRRLYKPSKAMHSGGWIYTEGMQDGLPNTSWNNYQSATLIHVSVHSTGSWLLEALAAAVTVTDSNAYFSDLLGPTGLKFHGFVGLPFFSVLANFCQVLAKKL